MSTGDWSKRAGRVGRAVARFRLSSQPNTRAWHSRTSTDGGGRCFGCDESFTAGESRVDVIVAETLVMVLHEECFETWKKFAAGPQRDNGAGDDPDDDE